MSVKRNGGGRTVASRRCGGRGTVFVMEFCDSGTLQVCVCVCGGVGGLGGFR